MEQKLTADFDESLDVCVVHTAVKDDEDCEGHCKHVVGDHLHLWIVEQEDCRNDKKPAAHEECDLVNLDPLVRTMSIFAAVKRADRFDALFFLECSALPLKHNVENDRGEVNSKHDRDRTNFIFSRGCVLIHTLEDDKGCHVEFQRVEYHVADKWIPEHHLFDFLRVLFALC